MEEGTYAARLQMTKLPLVVIAILGIWRSTSATTSRGSQAAETGAMHRRGRFQADENHKPRALKVKSYACYLTRSTYMTPKSRLIFICVCLVYSLEWDIYRRE